MSRRLAGSAFVLLVGTAMAQSGEIRRPDIATTPLPRSVSMDGRTYVDHGLVAAGSLPAGTVDFLGDTLGSFSSLMIEPGTWKRDGDTYTGVLWTLPDRGRNDPEHGLFFDYQGRMHRFRVRMTAVSGTTGPGAASASLTFTPDGGRAFRDFEGKPFTGAEPGKGTRTERGLVLPSPASGTGAGKLSLDAESLQFARDGGFYVGDEYAANVYRFDAGGRLQGVIVPPRSVQPLDADGNLDFTSLRAPATGRRNNQGVEGMALSPDGKRLFVVLQSALVQDTAPGDASGRALTRVLVYDVSHDATPRRPVAHYVVRLPTYAEKGSGGEPDRTAAQSEIRVLDTHRFLMLARDGAGLGADESKPIVYKSVLLVDTRQATNLAGTAYETATTSLRDARGELRPGIRTAAWKPLVDLLDPADLARFGLSVDRAQPGRTMLSEKWEAMDLVSALDPAHPDDWFLIVGNDNDFVAAHCVMDGRRCDSAFDNDNRILVYRLTLPGMRSTAAPNP
ncbi:esterase-like activity of phytase family protein [Luteibacter sp. UNCMF331Sha3.1]|uniref:esterase-like activity of phytase family protein n=1 Tax=Luteibacter sp. UNCMF331Sha3.1 TaxID=1502760 RepID=UPI001FCD023D|nr:esterase-like activity of phytase family protein [Luteibacter sp. UNCMF331Sha3.1]